MKDFFTPNKERIAGRDSENLSRLGKWNSMGGIVARKVRIFRTSLSVQQLELVGDLSIHTAETMKESGSNNSERSCLLGQRNYFSNSVGCSKQRRKGERGG